MSAVPGLLRVWSAQAPRARISASPCPPCHARWMGLWFELPLCLLLGKIFLSLNWFTLPLCNVVVRWVVAVASENSYSCLVPLTQRPIFLRPIIQQPAWSAVYIILYTPSSVRVPALKSKMSSGALIPREGSVSGAQKGSRLPTLA